MDSTLDEIPGALSEFFVPWTEISGEEIAAFNAALTAAANEAAMQEFLQENPRFLFQHLTAGRGYWVIPRKRLGAEHETDFLIAESDAGRLTWHAIEIERPQAPLFTAKGDPSAALTHALRQISDWRNWLSHNRDYASRSREHSGLGLANIDPELEGLVIMGRETQINASTEQLRRRLMRENRVRIHTYDWLVRRAEERLQVVNRREPLIDQLFQNEASRDSPDKPIRSVFGGIGSASMNVSATRSIDWNFITVEADGVEHEIVYEDIRTYRASDARTLSLHDWKDWLESSWDSSARFSLLASEIPPSDRLKESLTCHSDGIWFEIEEKPLSRINVLIYLPTTLAKEEKWARAQRAKSILEEKIPLARGSYHGKVTGGA
jgi:hypothetical protein